jgi:hypothetical protein
MNPLLAALGTIPRPPAPGRPIVEAQHDELAARIAALRAPGQNFKPGDPIMFKHGLALSKVYEKDGLAFCRWMEIKNPWDCQVSKLWAAMVQPGAFIAPDCYVAILDRDLTGISLLPVCSGQIEPFDAAAYEARNAKGAAAQLEPQVPGAA